jgi:DMSO/TMAO reductase YedYZ molybdopterin-dependent catalytic subunit
VNTPLSARRAIGIAVVALLAALAAGHLVAGVIGPNASPFVAVGNAVRDLSPHPVTEWAKATFGTLDKFVLLVGVAVVLAGCTVGAGLLSRRRAWPGALVATGLGVLGIVAVLGRTDLGQLGVLAPAAALLVGVVTFNWLHGHAVASTAGHSDSRRRFLRSTAGVVVGAGAAGVVGQLLASRVDVEASRAAVGPVRPAEPGPPVPRGADFAADGSTRFITSNADFYRIDTALTIPRVTAEEWRLRVHGMVDRELNLTFDDIRRRPLVERTVTLTCVSNEVGGGLISTARFVGVPIRDLLVEAGARPESDQLLSTSVDDFTAGTPVEVLMDEDRGSLLAIGMNGEPLPVEHGFPARMVVPGLYGYVSATKWVTDWELTTFAAKEGYWVPRGWSALGPIKIQSRIDRPRDGDSVRAGTVTIAGTAWAQPVGVERVEVRVDGGDWQPAELAAEVNRTTWRMWRVRLRLSRGRHEIEVRATGHDGATQTSDQAPPAPDGATGWHTITVKAD